MQSFEQLFATKLPVFPALLSISEIFFASRVVTIVTVENYIFLLWKNRFRLATRWLRLLGHFGLRLHNRWTHTTIANLLFVVNYCTFEVCRTTTILNNPTSEYIRASCNENLRSHIINTDIHITNFLLQNILPPKYKLANIKFFLD